MTDAGIERSLGIDALFQYTGSGVQLFSGAIFYLIIVRLFDTTIVGAIALFIAIVGLFNIVFSFGLGTAAQHFTSYNLGKRDYPSVGHTIRKIILIGFILSLLGFAFLQITAEPISILFLHSSQYTTLVRLLSIVILGNILFGILNGALLGLQNFRLSAILSIAIWVSYYFGSILFALVLRNVNTIVLGWIIGISIGVALELIFVLKFISRYQGPGKAPSANYLFAYSMPVLLSGLISYGAAYADRFVVAGLLNLSELGVYNFALLIVSSIGFISVPFNNILLPKFSEYFSESLREKISQSVKGSSLLLSSLYIPSALGIAALSPMILTFLGGENYEGGSSALLIIMILSSVFITSNILTQAIAAIRRTKLFLYSSGIALAANIAFSIILIPRFGLIGAALGFSSVYAATFIILFYFARKEQVVKFDFSGLAKVWISSTIMFVVVTLVRDTVQPSLQYSLLTLPGYILLGVIVYLVSARLLRVFGHEDKSLILSLFPERYAKIRKMLQYLVLH